MTTDGKEFVLTHVFKNVSSLKNESSYYSPIEENFGVPWKIWVVRSTDHLELYLMCEQEKEGKEWSIDFSSEFKIRTLNGRLLTGTTDHTFRSTEINNRGFDKFISWEDLMNEYVVDDTLRVDICVKIKNMTGISEIRHEDSTTMAKKEFVLTHVFKNISSMKGEEDSPTEEHFGVPWKICVGRNTDHLELHLACTQEKIGNEWAIEVSAEFEMRTVNGTPLSRTNEHTFKSTLGNFWGWKTYIKWEDLMKDYVIDDTLRVDIRVKIKNMTGITIAKRRFVLTHVFKNVLTMKDGVHHYSSIEEHFGIPWKISAWRSGGRFGLYLYCEEGKRDKEWSIGTWYEARINGRNEKKVMKNTERTFKSTDESNGWGWPEFIKLGDLMKDYVSNNTLRVEVYVKITKMVGIPKKNLRDFDKSTKEFSDVALMVENQKFYVSKQDLASQSSYFEAMFTRNFKESNQSEIPLKYVNAEDFQNFLELLLGENPIDESTIDGLVHLTNMYDAKLAALECEHFLIKSSEKSLKEKLRLAHRYNLENVKEDCLSKINTVSDIRSVTAGDTSEMDPSVLGELVQKLLALQDK